MRADVAAVKDAVNGILGLVRERSGEIERERRLSEDVVLALQRTGVNRLALPTALGGLQARTSDVMDIVERIAAVDGSTGWCAVIGAGSNLFAGYMREAAAREVFADPDQGSATMFAPFGSVIENKGRRLLSGRWPFTSNCLHSSWIGLGARIRRGEHVDPIARVVFVRAADTTIEDTWDVAGLRGTGSHHVSAREIAVDLDRSCTFSDRAWPEGTLWRLPLYTVLASMLVSVPLGVARGALDEIVRLIREGRTARRGQLADDPIAMADFAAAEARLRGARAAVREAVDEAYALAEKSEAVDRRLQARIHLANIHAIDVAVEVASVAHQLGGGAAVYEGNVLLRALNDVQAARQHLLFSHKHLSELGKVFAGIDQSYPPHIN
jgi:indole-3-acetate monooxygenase